MTDFINRAIQASKLKLTLKPNGPDRFLSIYESQHGTWTRPLLTQPGMPAPDLQALVYFHGMNAHQIEMNADAVSWARANGLSLADPATLPRFRALVDERDAFERIMGAAAYAAVLTGVAADISL